MTGQGSIKEKVYNMIMEDILSFEFRPNDILNEKTLIEKYGYSKTSVREALITLCEEGVLRTLPRYGYEVVRITTDDIRDMLQSRCILEMGLLSISYESFTEKQLARLEEIDDECTACDEDIWEHWRLNTYFHLKMISYCNNPYADELLQKTMDRLKRAYAQMYWNNRYHSSLSMDTRYHKEIIRCIRERDIENLKKAIVCDLSEFGGQNFLADMYLEKPIK